jgi:hypothetical protein
MSVTRAQSCRRHLVAHAHDVADRQRRRNRDIDRLEPRHRRNDLVAPLNVRVFDYLVTNAKGGWPGRVNDFG